MNKKTTMLFAKVFSFLLIFTIITPLPALAGITGSYDNSGAGASQSDANYGGGSGQNSSVGSGGSYNNSGQNPSTGYVGSGGGSYYNSPDNNSGWTYDPEGEFGGTPVKVNPYQGFSEKRVNEDLLNTEEAKYYVSGGGDSSAGIGRKTTVAVDVSDALAAAKVISSSESAVQSGWFSDVGGEFGGTENTYNPNATTYNFNYTPTDLDLGTGYTPDDVKNTNENIGVYYDSLYTTNESGLLTAPILSGELDTSVSAVPEGVNITKADVQIVDSILSNLTSSYVNNERYSTPTKDDPRGIRNNNPGNIENGTSNWIGLVDGTDPRFATFATPELGIRAIYKTQYTYETKYGLQSVRERVTRATPPEDNNDTEAYINAVAKEMGIDPDEAFSITDKEKATAYVEAVIKAENGTNPYSDWQVEEGYRLAFETKDVLTEHIPSVITERDVASIVFSNTATEDANYSLTTSENTTVTNADVYAYSPDANTLSNPGQQTLENISNTIQTAWEDYRDLVQEKSGTEAWAANVMAEGAVAKAQIALDAAKANLDGADIDSQAVFAYSEAQARYDKAVAALEVTRKATSELDTETAIAKGAEAVKWAAGSQIIADKTSDLSKEYESGLTYTITVGQSEEQTLQAARDYLWDNYLETDWSFKDKLAAANKYGKLATGVTWGQIVSGVAKGTITKNNFEQYLNGLTDNDLKNYVVGGIDPEFAVLVAEAGKAMEADGKDFQITSGFRDDERQSLITGGVHANVGNSWHGGSHVTEGYGSGVSIDISGSAAQNWIDEHGSKYGIARPYGDKDAPHIALASSGEVHNRAGRVGGMDPDDVDAIYDKTIAGAGSQVTLDHFTADAAEQLADGDDVVIATHDTVDYDALVAKALEDNALKQEPRDSENDQVVPAVGTVRDGNTNINNTTGNSDGNDNSGYTNTVNNTDTSGSGSNTSSRERGLLAKLADQVKNLFSDRDNNASTTDESATSTLATNQDETLVDNVVDFMQNVFSFFGSEETSDTDSYYAVFPVNEDNVDTEEAYVPIHIKVDQDTGEIAIERGSLQNGNSISELDRAREYYYKITEPDESSLVIDDDGRIVYSDGRYAPTASEDTLSIAAGSDVEYVYLVERTRNGEIITAEVNDNALPGNLFTNTVRNIFSDNSEFTLNDVVTITYDYVDPDSSVQYDEYYDYTITLSNGSERSISLPVTTSLAYYQKQLGSIGYSGDVFALTKQAIKTGEHIDEQDTGFISQIVNGIGTVAKKVASVFTDSEQTETEYTEFSSDTLESTVQQNGRFASDDIQSVLVRFESGIDCPALLGFNQGYVYSVSLHNVSSSIQYSRCGSGDAYSYAEAIANHLETTGLFSDVSAESLLEKMIFTSYDPDNLDDSSDDTSTETGSTVNSNSISFEVKVSDSDGSTKTDWTTDDVTIHTGQQLDFRWSANEYKQCLLFIADNGAFSFSRFGRLSSTSGNTEDEGYDVYERAGVYYIECGNQVNEEDVDTQSIQITVE